MSEYRKIIKFGTNSQVISLPKAWTKQNKLSPGDVVAVDAVAQSLMISPAKEETKKLTRDITVQIDKYDYLTIRNKIINAYVNNYDLIILRGKKILTENMTIRSIVHQLMALEILEETAEKIVAKCFLNMNDIKVMDIMRKIDAIIKSMFIDVVGLVKEPKKFGEVNIIKNIDERDDDINRLTYLILRTIKYLFSNPRADSDTTLLLKGWEVAKIFEHIGDEVKRIAPFIDKLDKEDAKKIIKFIELTQQQYSSAMKAYYKGDSEAFYKLAVEQKSFLSSLEEYQEKHKSSIVIAETLQKVRTLYNRVHDLTIALI